MKLLHGTSASYIESILSKGLIPQYSLNWVSPGKVPGFPGVYLANNDLKAEFYALRASMMASNNHYAVMEVDVSEDELYPDENIIVNKVLGHKEIDISPEVMSKAVSLISENRHLWEDSLKFGYVAHQSPIAASDIKIYKQDEIVNNNWYWMIEDTGTIQEMDDKMMCFLDAQHKGIITDFHKQKIVTFKFNSVFWDCNYQVVNK